MAGTNQFKAFATGRSAYTLTAADYAALTEFLANGFPSGIVDGAKFNTVLRQACMVAASLGKIVSDANLNALDDGNVSALAANIYAALRASLVGQSTTITAGNGLTGGGSLNGPVTLHMGTPATCSSTSTNVVTADSHSHALSIPASSGSVVGITRYAAGTEASDMLLNNVALTPGGLGLALVSGANIKRAGKTVFETGISGSMGPDANVTLTFPEAFSTTPVVIPYMINSSTANDDVFARVVAVSATQCTLRAENVPNPSNSGTRSIGYLAIGTIN